MRKPILVFLALAIGVVLVACRPAKTVSNSLPDIVFSDDGQAHLTIPAGALPTGTKLSDVHLTRLLPEQESPTTESNLLLANYELDPDGLVFQQPITFSEVISGPLTIMPILMLGSGASRELLANVHLLVDPATNQSLLSAPVRHFGQIKSLNGFVEVRILLGGPLAGVVAVGQSFTEKVQWGPVGYGGRIVLTKDAAGVTQVMIDPLPTQNYTGTAMLLVRSQGIFTIQDGKFSATDNISPKQYDAAPQDLDEQPAYTEVERTFQCMRVGDGSISHRAESIQTIILEDYAIPKGFGPKSQFPVFDPNATQQPPFSAAKFVSQVVYDISVAVQCRAATTP